MPPLLFSLRRWRPGHLLLGWGAYWVGLLAVVLGPAIPAVLRATGEPQSKGSVSAGMKDGVVQFLVADGGETLWSLNATGSQIALWFVGPPLVLWAAWLIRRRGARDEPRSGHVKPAELPLPQGEDITIEPATGERVKQARDRA